MKSDLSISQPQYAKGFILVLFAAFCYGLQPYFAHQAYQAGADPVGLLLARFTLAAGLMLLWLKKRKLRLPAGRPFAQTLLIGIGYAVAAMGYYRASHSTSVSLAVILLFSFPVFVTLFSIFFLKEQTNWRKMLSLLLASAGVMLATGMDFHGDLEGVLWALFAALSYGAAILYGTHKMSSQSPLVSATVILAGGAITLALIGLLQGAAWPQTVAGWGATLGLALFATLLPLAAFVGGSPHIGASNASTLSMLEPIVAVSIAVLLIGERFSSAMLWGGALVVIAATMLSSSQRQPTACQRIAE
ncbi:DMT family transporter [Marinobacterium arenosum]|uniref:DMT family transporter n=1 Tax=Marinobacterium arenosum TaxID=2862496 RepID=UPI001C962079|nr:EamA family transporter [Marinobacterium arenosum]MBY4675881.1 DMT family transporter [Marinobacterium arenosum]